MRKIDKDEIPECLSGYQRKHRNATYDALGKTEDGRNVKTELKSHKLSQQKQLCCYCCIRLDNENIGSHIEHIRPRDKYPNLSLDYNNLLISCGSE